MVHRVCGGDQTELVAVAGICRAVCARSRHRHIQVARICRRRPWHVDRARCVSVLCRGTLCQSLPAEHRRRRCVAHDHGGQVCAPSGSRVSWRADGPAHRHDLACDPRRDRRRGSGEQRLGDLWPRHWHHARAGHLRRWHRAGDRGWYAPAPLARKTASAHRSHAGGTAPSASSSVCGAHRTCPVALHSGRLCIAQCRTRTRHRAHTTAGRVVSRVATRQGRESAADQSWRTRRA